MPSKRTASSEKRTEEFGRDSCVSRVNKQVTHICTKQTDTQCALTKLHTNYTHGSILQQYVYRVIYTLIYMGMLFAQTLARSQQSSECNPLELTYIQNRQNTQREFIIIVYDGREKKTACIEKSKITRKLKLTSTEIIQLSFIFTVQ